jgi:hypothetical protein
MQTIGGDGGSLAGALRRGRMQTECSRQRGNPGFRTKYRRPGRQRGSRGRFQDNDLERDRRHADLPIGGLTGTVYFSREKLSVKGMASMRRGRSPGSMQGLDVRSVEKNPRQANRTSAWGSAWGLD